MSASTGKLSYRIVRFNFFRLVTKNTIEERILQRAQQKQDVQQTVYSGETFKAEAFKRSEVSRSCLEDVLFTVEQVVDLLFNDEELKQNEIIKNKEKKIAKEARKLARREAKAAQKLKEKEENDKKALEGGNKDQDNGQMALEEPTNPSQST